jgi:hypothetical protein
MVAWSQMRDVVGKEQRCGKEGRMEGRKREKEEGN